MQGIGGQVKSGEREASLSLSRFCVVWMVGTYERWVWCVATKVLSLLVFALFYLPGIHLFDVLFFELGSCIITGHS